MMKPYKLLLILLSLLFSIGTYGQQEHQADTIVKENSQNTESLFMIPPKEDIYLTIPDNREIQEEAYEYSKNRIDELNLNTDTYSPSLPWDPAFQSINSSNPFGKDYEKKDNLSFSLSYAFVFSGKRSSYPTSGSITSVSMLYETYLSNKWGLSVSPYVSYYSLHSNRRSSRDNGIDGGVDLMLSYFLTENISLNAYRHQSFNIDKHTFNPFLHPMLPQNRTGFNIEFSKNNASFSIGVEHVEYKGGYRVRR